MIKVEHCRLLFQFLLTHRTRIHVGCPVVTCDGLFFVGPLRNASWRSVTLDKQIPAFVSRHNVVTSEAAVVTN